MDDTTRNLLTTVGVFLLLALGLSTLTGGMMGGHMMFGPGVVQDRGWLWGFGMGLGGLVMLLFWGALIVGIVLLVRQVGNGAPVPPAITPFDVLKRRYAAGEITREQYEQIRRDLEGTSK
jgi:putative membrane protein